MYSLRVVLQLFVRSFNVATSINMNPGDLDLTDTVYETISIPNHFNNE